MQKLGCIVTAMVALALFSGCGSLGPVGGKSISTQPDASEAIAGLGHSSFKIREKSQRLLISSVGNTNTPFVVDECLAAWSKSDDPEVKLRLRDIIYNAFDSRIALERRSFLGIHMELVMVDNPDGGQLCAVRVQAVVPGTAAAESGILVNDAVLSAGSLDMDKSRSLQEFVRHIQFSRPGSAVLLRILRQGEIIEKETRLKELPPEVRAGVMGDTSSREDDFEYWLKRRASEAVLH